MSNSRSVERTRKSIQIGVRDFGPIADALVKLRPLTVFVGPSNTGKTYMSILVYALHKSLRGFQRLPVSHPSLNYPYYLIGSNKPGDASPSEDTLTIDNELYALLTKIGRAAVTYSDLPQAVRDNVQAVLRDPERLGRDVELELKRCLDSRSNSDFIRAPSADHELGITLRVGEEGRDLWSFRMSMSEGGTTVAGDIADVELMCWAAASDDTKRARLREILARPRLLWSTSLLEMAADSPGDQGRIHYFPAARSGIMQSHRVIASSLVKRSTQAGLENLVVPTLSGVIADFMQQIILYEERERPDNGINQIADELDLKVLAGQIITNPSPTGYPEFCYRSQETEEGIRLTRSSSMVSELAPLALFIRGLIRPGDTLIIEEPEAHLHPAAQPKIAVTLASLVRVGVRVVVTTHSDWMLQAIGNLMREGQLGDHTIEPASWLELEEVGAWLFQENGQVKEIKFDRIKGIEPMEYQEVAENLYNRWAMLENRLNRTRGDSKREQE
jgi:hypothetical protein